MNLQTIDLVLYFNFASLFIDSLICFYQNSLLRLEMTNYFQLLLCRIYVLHFWGTLTVKLLLKTLIWGSVSLEFLLLFSGRMLLVFT